MAQMLARCPCGEEVGYGSLSTAEERDRGLCLRCEASGPPAPPPPSPELVELCLRAHELRVSHRADWQLEARIRTYPLDDIRAACRSIGIGTM